jgi:hypothetical protein
MAKMICVWAAVSLACNFSAPPPATTSIETDETAIPAPPTATPGSTGVEEFSAQATSLVAVRLKWQSVVDAGGYQIEARYGGGEFFPVAEVAADQTSYDHFTVPGNTDLTYRLSAITGAARVEIASATVAMPDLVPNPWVVQPMPAVPSVGDIPDFTALPTLDPGNPDPSVLATLTAFADAFGSGSSAPQPQPIWVKKDIGPEGGTLTLTAPSQRVFSLEVPAGALDEMTPLYLVPIGEIADFPFSDGHLGAVQIHPPIPFGGPLILTIESPDDQAVASDPITVGFSVSSFNNELSLAPIYAAGSNTYQMRVYWGDTFGLALATAEELKTQAGRVPSDSGEQLRQQLALLRAFNTDASPAGEVRAWVQLIEGLLEQMKDLRGQDSRGVHARLAAPPRRPDLQSQGGRDLWEVIQRWDTAWDQTYTSLPEVTSGTEPLDNTRRAALIEEVTGKIKAFLDGHNGCRSQGDLFAQALRQMLIAPETDFQRRIAHDYRSRFGLPAKQCTYQLHIVESTIVNEVHSDNGTLTDTVRVHTNPIPLELVVRGAKLAFRGIGPVTYEKYEHSDSSCPPAIEVAPYPSAAIWITDLTLIFDAAGRVSNFALQGVFPDPISGNDTGTWTTEIDENGNCTSINWESHEGEHVDVWGTSFFPGVHNRYIHSDTWSIAGDESYVATSNVSDFQQGAITESTTMLLTVNQEGR